MDKAKKEAIRRQLEIIENENNGRLTPEAVVRKAEDPTNPLHDIVFEKSQADAAYAHRLDIARELIRSVKVEVRVDKLVIATPFYVRDPSQPSDQQGYVRTASLRTKRDLAQDAIEAELGRVVAALSRAYAIASALDLEDEFEQLLAHATTLRERAKNAA